MTDLEKLLAASVEIETLRAENAALKRQLAAKPAKRNLARAAAIRSLIEDSGMTRREAAAHVDAFGTEAV